MRVLLSKFCEYVTKLENGRHSLLGIFDDIRTDRLPIEHPPFYMAIQVEFDREEMGQTIAVGLRFVAPDNREILRSEIQVEVPKSAPQDHLLVFFFAPIASMNLAQTGVHRFLVSSQGDLVHTEKLPVVIVQPVPSS